jgi:ribosomal protein S12 methylthiotransferase accessory factor YcaO
LLWWAQAGRWRDLAWLFDGPGVRVPVEGPAADTGAELERLLAWFRAADEDVLVVDLVDEPAVVRLGHHAVAVVAPGLHPMHLDEMRPAHWSRRLAAVPRVFGVPAPITLNPLPHPFP